MTRKNEIILKLSKKLFEEVTGVAKFIGITREEYLLMLILRTQPIPVQVPVEAPVQFQPDVSMLEDQAREELENYNIDLATDKKLKIKTKKQDCSYLG